MKKAYEQQGLSVIAVNLDQDPHDAEKFLAKYQPNFEIRFDPHGKSAEQFDVQGMPTSIIIDRHGARRFTHIGFRPVDSVAYEDELRQLLEER